MDIQTLKLCEQTFLPESLSGYQKRREMLDFISGEEGWEEKGSLGHYRKALTRMEEDE